MTVPRQRPMAILVALLLLLGLAPATAAIKAGVVCNKAGVSKTVAGKKLVCTKSGNKTVWKVKKSRTNKQPISPAIPTATPKAEPDYGWYGWSFKVNESGVLVRRGGPITNWSDEASRPGEVIDPIRLKAFEAIKAYQATVAIKPVNINFHFAPNVASDVIAAFKVFFKQSQDFFSSRIPAGTVLEVVISSEKDDGWRKNKYLSVLPTVAEANSLFEREAGMFDAIRATGINNSGGGSVSGTSNSKLLIYAGGVCSCFKAENLLMYNVPHEMTHYFQFAVTPGIPKQNFTQSGGKLTEGKIYIPHALGEGSANTLGSALTVKHVGWYSDQMNWHLGRFKRNSQFTQIASIAEVIELLSRSESYLPTEQKLSGYEYVLGQLAYEYFIASYGVANFLDLYENIYMLQDFDQAMQETIKKSKADFYAQAAPYVLAAFNQIKP